MKYNTFSTPSFWVCQDYCPIRIYENGKVYLFNLVGYYDNFGLLTNLVENNDAKVLSILKGIVDDRTLNNIEKMLFERI